MPRCPLTADWKSQAETPLKALWTPELDPLFWRSDRRGVESAWYGHVPFAHWLVRALAPRCVVELGSHNGVSYSAFCEAAQREGLGARCFAIDTWTGDQQAGFYQEEVFAGLRAYHDPRFGAFSTLLRRRFDDALENFGPGSIDLLHIDGRHGYDDVRHDFETWRGKMSERGVVLFHDTNARDDGFGVWRYWSELRQAFPHFEFLHAHGLGVLVVGAQCPPAIAALTELRDTRAVGAVRERFAQLGERCVFEAQANLLGALSAKRAQENEALQARLHKAEAELMEVRAAMAQACSEAARAQSGLARAERAAEAERAQAARAQAAAEAACQAEAERRASADAALACVLSSGTWRATRPVRTTLSWLPAVARRLAFRALQALWRTFTPHLNSSRAAPPVAPPPLPQRQRPAPGRSPPLVCYVSGEPDTPGMNYRVHRYAAACRAAGARVIVLRLTKWPRA